MLITPENYEQNLDLVIIFTDIANLYTYIESKISISRKTLLVKGK